MTVIELRCTDCGVVSKDCDTVFGNVLCKGCEAKVNDRVKAKYGKTKNIVDHD